MPNAGERFFQYMEKEQGHRHWIQRESLLQIGRAQSRVVIIAIIALVGSCAAAMLGQAWGLVGVFGALTPMLGAIWIRHREQKQLAARSAAPTAPDDHDNARSK